MEVSKNTITPIKQIYDWAITEFLFYASYLLEESEKKLKELRKIKSR